MEEEKIDEIEKIRTGGILDSFRDQLKDKDTQKIELTNKLVEILIDDNHPEIVDLKTTVLEKSDLATWELTIELMDTFLVDEFILDAEKRNRLKFLKRKIYNARISIEGRGRSDILQSISNYLVSINADELKEKLPFRVGRRL